MKRNAEESDSSIIGISKKKHLLTDDLPWPVIYWMTNDSKHDCFFNVGPETGPIERIGAIKILLMGQSEVLEKMLDERKCELAETGDIRVPDSDPETFKNWLMCVYGGTDVLLSKLSYEDCLKLMYLCEKYLMLDMKEKISSCILELHEPLSINNVMTALSHPACLESKTLSRALSKVIQKNTFECITQEYFMDLNPDAVLFIAKQERISIEEVDLWSAVLIWAKEKAGNGSKDLRTCLKNILKHIRFCVMTAEDFCTFVVPHDVLTPDETVQICKFIGSKTAPQLDELNCSDRNRYKTPSEEFNFTHVVNNIDTFSHAQKSRAYKLGMFRWWIKFKNEAKGGIEIHLCCTPITRMTSWECYASAEIVAVNHDNKLKSHRKLLPVKKFSEIGKGWKLEFHSLDYLRNIENGFKKNNSLEIMVRVELFDDSEEV